MSESEILRASPLFSGLTDEEINRELSRYGATRRAYSRGETLLREGYPVERFAFVLSGRVQIMSDDINGQHMIMATVSPGQTFGESLCFRLEKESPVYAEALERCEVYWLDAAWLRTDASARFVSMLTRKTLSMNDRIQVLSKLTIRDKLLTLFSQLARGETEFVLPFDREDLAAYLGANRAAVSREMSRMQREGLITYTKNHVTINK